MKTRSIKDDVRTDPRPRRPGGGPRPGARALRRTAPHAGAMFFFFSNRLGCLGSILLSAAGTLLLIGILVLLQR